MLKSRLLAAVTIVLVHSLAFGGSIIDDDFDGTSLDTSVWTPTLNGGTISVASSILTLQAAGSSRPEILSVDTVTLGAAGGGGDTVILTTTDMDMQKYSSGAYFGLRDSSWENSIWIATTGSQPLIQMRKNDGTYQSLGIHDTKYMMYGWTLTWSGTQVVLESSTWGTIFDSADPLLNGGISWNIPAVGSEMHVWAKAGTSAALTFDDITLSQIPEPATMALLAMGGCGVLLRRRRG